MVFQDKVELLTISSNEFINSLESTLKQIITLDTDLFELNELKSVHTNNVAESVYNAVDDKGKQIYSNQEKRDLAIETTLGLNPEYVKIKDKTRQMQTFKNNLGIDAEILRNKIKLNNLNLQFYSNNEVR